MEEHWLWYLTGSIDTAATITVKVQKDERLSIGYSINPVLMYSRPTEVDSVFGMIEEYSQEHGIRYRIEELENSNRYVVEKPDSIRRFLEPLQNGFIQQRERVELMLDEFLPLVEEGRPTTKEDFIEAIEVTDEIREHPIQTRETKYDAEYFKDEWSDQFSE